MCVCVWVHTHTHTQTHTHTHTHTHNTGGLGALYLGGLAIRGASESLFDALR